MFIIRKEQLDVLERARLEDLMQSLTSFLRAHDAQARVEPGLEHFVAAQLRAARHDGMATHRDYSLYVLAAWLSPGRSLAGERRPGGILWRRLATNDKVARLRELINASTLAVPRP